MLRCLSCMPLGEHVQRDPAAAGAEASRLHVDDGCVLTDAPHFMLESHCTSLAHKLHSLLHPAAHSFGGYFPAYIHAPLAAALPMATFPALFGTQTDFYHYSFQWLSVLYWIKGAGRTRPSGGSREGGADRCPLSNVNSQAESILLQVDPMTLRVESRMLSSQNLQALPYFQLVIFSLFFCLSTVRSNSLLWKKKRLNFSLLGSPLVTLPIFCGVKCKH